MNEEHEIRFLNGDGLVSLTITFYPKTGSVHIEDEDTRDNIFIDIAMLERIVEVVNNIKHI